MVKKLNVTKEHVVKYLLFSSFVNHSVPLLEEKIMSLVSPFPSEDIVYMHGLLWILYTFCMLSFFHLY